MAEGAKWNSDEIVFYTSVAKIQKQMRKISLRYLCQHPEIRAILRVILHQAINHKPKDIMKFTANFFNCYNTPILTSLINEQLKQVHKQLRKGHFSRFDGEMFFTESHESTHSLLSKSSTMNSVNPVLAFALVLEKPDECDL